MIKRVLSILFCIVVGVVSLQAQTVWYTPQSDIIAGRGWAGELQGTYHRLPERVKDSLREKHWNLSRNSAGLTVKFHTNAPSVVVRYVIEGDASMPHMPSTGVSGVDLYQVQEGVSKGWCRSLWGYNRDTVTYTFNDLEYGDKAGADYELFLPLYVTVTDMKIGVSQSSEFNFQQPSTEKPIVCYGTSITQGACASRPAMSWTNILKRKLNKPLVNLGFSGQGQLDMAMFRMLGELDASLYLIDCMPNMTRTMEQYIYQRVLDGVRYLRTQSQSPIILAEHSGYMNELSSPEAFRAYAGSNKELRRAYEQLKKEGVKGLHYVTKEEIGLTPDSQVDGVHPSDIGMQQYADAYYRAIKKILK